MSDFNDYDPLFGPGGSIAYDEPEDTRTPDEPDEDESPSLPGFTSTTDVDGWHEFRRTIGEFDIVVYEYGFYSFGYEILCGGAVWDGSTMSTVERAATEAYDTLAGILTSTAKELVDARGEL